MEPRVSFVTLAVRDLDRSRRFYVGGLGWEPALDVPGDVLMFRVGAHLVLSLWAEAAFEAEVGPIGRGDGVAPLTLAHNVATRAEVDAVLATARAAGADPVGTAVEREWGGYTGYFADPDGYRWEVAENPGPIGQVVLPPAGAPRDPVPLSVEDALGRLTFRGDRTPASSDADMAGAFAALSAYRDGAVYVGHWAGSSEWERHPEGDELVMVVDGATTLFTLHGAEERAHALGPGQLLVVPRGVWHRFETPDEVRVLSVTPQPSDHRADRPTDPS
jgi:catechol 2,3-dioxygenase-like lactoylglutathione lyase family enzyme/mannose-6-phosphate isomerase-like protein (cupin superfamily)